MFNPLGILKKKPTEQPTTDESTNEPVVEKQVQVDDIAIHTMPERFRNQAGETDSSKKTGLLIIGAGVVFLILVMAFLYFYLFKKPAAEVTSSQTTPAVTLPAETKITVPPEPETAKPQGNLTTGTTTEPVPPANGGGVASTSTPEAIEEDLPLGLIPALDSDNDGLTNMEEIIFGTSTTTPDTDGDGYFDGAELLNLYNPASTTRLIANPKITLYENKTFNYSVLYPTAWRMSLNGGDDSIMFKSDDNQFFQIIVQFNAAGETIDQWYLEQLAVFSINDSARVGGTNWQGIKNLDGLTVYLMDSKQGYIFTLAYNPGENNILDYINIFNMMIKSFTLKQ